mmetsp:Transcript_5004/g.14363  ORF Transcript_5004/g.14363 Transcript_5004/m.14363 type:complete len:202 (-) Transcript_5004:238-843(-)
MIGKGTPVDFLTRDIVTPEVSAGTRTRRDLQELSMHPHANPNRNTELGFRLAAALLSSSSFRPRMKAKVDARARATSVLTGPPFPLSPAFNPASTILSQIGRASPNTSGFRSSVTGCATTTPPTPSPLSTRTVPSMGSSAPARRRRRVDFPLPLLPKRTVTADVNVPVSSTLAPPITKLTSRSAYSLLGTDEKSFDSKVTG